MKHILDVPKRLDNPGRLSRYLRMMRRSGVHPNALRLMRRAPMADAHRVPQYARIERGRTA